MLKIILFFLTAFFLQTGVSLADGVKGITASINQKNFEKTLYLTLDACGSENGTGFDENLINFLIENNIPATLFLSGKWINKNYDTAVSLSQNNLFKIENHGTNHVPACLNAMTVYGIKGTASKEELLYEVCHNASKIEEITGRKPSWFRSGTAYYDRAAIDIITKELGIMIAGFSISADEGATLSEEKVYANVMKAKPGYIIIAHMNHPESRTFYGLKTAISELLREGFVFKVLPDNITD